MIINTISDIKKIVLEIVLFTLLLLALLYMILTQGIEIPAIHLGKIDIQKLYLKLDKKLILKIDHLDLRQKGGNSKLPEEIGYINIIGKYFQTIEIKHLTLENEDITIIYKDGLFKAKGKAFQSFLQLFYNKQLHRLEVQIKKYFNKKYNLSLKGILRIYKNKRLFAMLDYTFEGISGKAKFLLKDRELTFNINSTTFNNQKLKRVFSHLQLHPLIKTWSYEKVKAKSYKLLFAKGRVNVEHPNVKHIVAKVVGNDVKVWFQKGIDPVYIPKVTLHYKNDNLYFTFDHPHYHQKDLSGSKVTIYNLTKKESYIDIFLKTYAPLDQDIKEIVASYGIELPLLQKKGDVNAELLIRVRFKDGKVNLKGEFFTQQSLFDLDGLELFAKKLFVKLRDSKILIKKSLLAFPPFAEANVRGSIDLTKRSGKLLLQDGTLHITYNDFTLLQMEKVDDTILIDLLQKKIHLQKLGFHYWIEDKKVTIDHLEDLTLYSTLLKKLKITQGSLTYILPKQIIFVNFQKPYSPFFKKEAIKDFMLTVNLKQKEAKLNDFATIDFKNGVKASLHDVGIDLTHFKSDGNPQKLVAKLQNVALRYKKHHLFIKEGLFRSAKKGFTLIAHTQKGTIQVKKSTKVTIQASNLTAATLNAVIGKNIFYQGIYQIKAAGTKDEIQGRLFIMEGYLKDLKLINNFMAFINTIPALITLSDPGFDKTGLLVKNGTIDFIYTDNTLILSDIKLRSVSMDIVGSGIIDLKAKTVKMRLELQTLKNVAKVIKNIPLAGYILLGKDGTISTAVEVYGSLEDPKFRSLLPSDTIKMPFNIIKRTLELPFKLFE